MALIQLSPSLRPPPRLPRDCGSVSNWRQVMLCVSLCHDSVPYQVEAPFHCGLIRSAKRGGYPGKNGVTSNSSFSAFPLFRKIRFVWSLLQLDTCVLCLTWNLLMFFEGSILSPTSALSRAQHTNALPDIARYLGPYQRKEWRLIKLSLLVFCQQSKQRLSRGQH